MAASIVAAIVRGISRTTEGSSNVGPQPKVRESVVLPLRNVTGTILGVTGNRIRVGISAPVRVRICRGEKDGKTVVSATGLPLPPSAC